MAKIKVDLWGRTETEPNFNTKPQQAFEIDAPESGDGVIYTRYFDRTICCVHRTTIATDNGRTNVKKDVAFGPWADRASLDYDEAGNYPKYITVED